jgi:hypothetical protein
MNRIIMKLGAVDVRFESMEGLERRPFSYDGRTAQVLGVRGRFAEITHPFYGDDINPENIRTNTRSKPGGGYKVVDKLIGAEAPRGSNRWECNAANQVEEAIIALRREGLSRRAAAVMMNPLLAAEGVLRGWIETRHLLDADHGIVTGLAEVEGWKPRLSYVRIEDIDYGERPPIRGLPLIIVEELPDTWPSDIGTGVVDQDYRMIANARGIAA